MNTSNLKAYAPKARRDFIAAVTKQAQKYGVTKEVTHPVKLNGDVCVINGKPFPARLASTIQKLGKRVESNGFEHTMEQVAYSWFNRLIAIRYMELHDYLGHGRRVLSHPEHPTGFQILEECTDLSYGNDGDAGQLPHLSYDKVVELKLDGTKDEELYRELLLAQCHALHTAMPFLFEALDDETELLLPNNLTKTDSLIHDLITELPESDWQSIEVVGWLYQFYIAEKKDQVIGKVVKTEDIPAATQLFTPNWIVKYMVQNSLGAQWLATYPDSPLKAQMDYYITPAEQSDEVNAQLQAITPSELNPEELTLIDPASGSGHILVEAYDLFKAIYLERGYRQRDIAKLILENNLFGLDIDQRAAQLTGFALMMKGREDDRRLFERGIKLNIMAMHNSSSLDPNTLAQGINLASYQLNASDLSEFIALFEHAHDFGSLIQIPPHLADKLPALNNLVQNETHNPDLFVSEALQQLTPLVEQANILAAQYDAVVANPPYMGSKGMNTVVKKFAKDNFPNAKSDLFACFIERGHSLANATGYNAMVTMQSWMFLSSFEAMRTNMLTTKTITSMAHLGARAFGSISGEVVQTTACVLKNSHIDHYKPVFYRLLEGNEEQKRAALIAGDNRYEQTAQDEFKKIPGSRLAYWVYPAIISAFDIGRPIGSAAKKGLSCSGTERFYRYFWEVSVRKLALSGRVGKWVEISKGGEFRKWYGNKEIRINWEQNGASVKSRSGSVVRNEPYYFKKGLSWNDISTGVFACRFVGTGSIPTDSGPMIYDNERESLIACLLNSKVSEPFLEILCPTIHFGVGQVANLPIIVPEGSVDISYERARMTHKFDWDFYERSWDFQSFPMLSNSSEPIPGLKSSYNTWISQNQATIAEMQRLEEENNRLFIDAYGLQEELTPEVPIEQITLTVNPAYRYGVKGTEEERNTRFREDTMAELVSYAIGCMMGRYSLDEPGLIYANSGNEGFDALIEAGKYNTFPADDDGIVPLTDAEWFADDAANRLVEFISVAWNKECLEENLDFLAANLSPKKSESSRDTIRRYLCDKFYKDHLQTYKKRPIYWLFSSGKQKAFQCLVYLHRYNESTLARLRTEYVIPLTAKLSAHINKLDDDKLASSSAAEIKKLEKEIKRLQKQQTELTEFDEKLKHFADMRISLDLDDGVKVNYGKFGDLLAEVKAIHGKVSS